MHKVLFDFIWPFTNINIFGFVTRQVKSYVELENSIWPLNGKTCSWNYLTTHSKPREIKTSANGEPKKQQIWKFLKVNKK